MLEHNHPSYTATLKMSPQEENELILRYLEHELPPEEELRVQDSLIHPDFRKRFTLFVRDQAALYELDLPVVLLPVPSSGGQTQGWAARYGVLAMAASVMLAIGVGLSTLFESTSPEPPLEVPLASRATISGVEGMVLLNGNPVQSDTIVHEKDLIESLGSESSSVVHFHDGTTISLAGNSSVRLSSFIDQKLIDVQQGKVAVEAAKQPPKHPMLLRTATASLTVLGTAFALTSEEEETAIHVTKGIVDFRSKKNSRKDVRVVAGKSAIASRQGPAHFRPSRPVENTWAYSFDEPNDKLIENQNWAGKVEGAFGVSYATRSLNPSSEVPYRVTTKEQWLDGLFKITDQTYINYRIRMTNNDWYHVILATRDANYGQTDRDGNFEYQEEENWNAIAPNHWRTVSVPLSKFRATQSGDPVDTPVSLRKSPPPRLGDVAFMISFGSPEESRGLVIDRIWVTDGPPDELP